MNPANSTLDAKAVAAMSADALLQSLGSTAGGLTQAEAAQRLAQGGPNSLPEQHVSLLMRLLRYFWGPIPWMIEVAALLSALVRHWPDFIIIVLLLLFNAGIGFWQEF
ncbi:MAG: hypothetical protein B7X36_07905, partial [Thiomonas sp. 14-64-326]